MKRFLALLMSAVMVFSAVGVTSFVTGNNVLEDASEETVSEEIAVTADTAQRNEEEDGDAILLSDTEEGVSGAASKLSAAIDSEETASGSSETKSEYLDENNALTVPYDIAYPEAFADEDCLYTTDTILVKFQKSFNGKVNAALKKAGITAVDELFSTEDGTWYEVSVTGEVQEVMTKVRALKNVVLAEYNYVYESTSIIDCAEVDVCEAVKYNPHWHDEWHLRSGHLQDGWEWMDDDEDTSAGGSSTVVVAVIDTGVDYTHQDLKDNIWYNTKEIPDNGVDDDANGYIDDYYGVNLETSKGSGMDDNGHGTHVAGIIASDNNNLGTVGVAYNVKIMPIKAGMASGYFTQAQIAAGILYAYENGADVINMSFGGSASTIAVQDALETAYTRCVLVAAAGNDGLPNEYRTAYPIYQPSYPAALSYVLGVMSVDENGMESSFTNYDVNAYNSVEYEVYAPGSQIMSTIPGNKYAIMSGTSMAAPYVSAVAALLRSAYPDRDTYPTKFIYGQIASTGETTATCCSTAAHGLHNLPKIVDVYNALTELPQPEVSASDFILFDDASLSDKNNGDGVIDAGETVAIGFTLRNRWGAAKDATIHLDAKSQVGIDCPYITFAQNDVNYGQIGTYATNDFGKTKEGEFVTGLDTENSLIFTVADNCPNDYIITVNLTVTCKNDLDKTDMNTYTSTAKTNLEVRRGVILPNIISEDMTWTKENYYIIPNAMTIQAGATVTVEPGTQIQFWSDDPNDAYADTAITYLKVEGTLLCKGTAEEHIRMFPSELKSQYQVQFYESGSGCIKLWYTDVVNGYLYGNSDEGITYAYGCEFSQNYRARVILYRYLSNGKVEISSHYSGCVHADLLENCVVYKMGCNSSYGLMSLYADCASCLFVDSAIGFSGSYEYTDCIFYGNNNYLGESDGATSSYTAPGGVTQITTEQILKDTSTGTTYITLPWSKTALRLAEYLGGSLCCMETAEEQAFLQQNLAINARCATLNNDNENYVYFDGYRYLCGLRENAEGILCWLDGTAADVSLWTAVPKGNEWINRDGGVYYWYGPYKDQYYAGYCDYSSSYILFEFPDTTITDITVPEDEISMDTGMTKQLLPEVEPAKTALAADLTYTSLDEGVVTVSASGLIAPVAAGGTVVRISNADGSVYKDVAVHVTDCVPLEGLSLNEEALRLAIGTTRQLTPVFAPQYTTRTGAAYTSSDESVAAVDINGTVRAVGVGTATITVTPAMGESYSAAATVTVVKPAESISFEESIYVTTLTQQNDDLGLVITPDNATDKTVLWESSNPEVCEVDENGQLVKHQEGTATLRATLRDTDLSAEIVVCITDIPQTAAVEEMQYYSYNDKTTYYARLSDGTLWRWGKNYKSPQKLPFTNVMGFAYFGYYGDEEAFYILSTDGSVQLYDVDGTIHNYDSPNTGYHYCQNWFNYGKPISNVTKIAAYSNSFCSHCSFYAIKQDGTVWAWGRNEYGQLGDSTTTDRAQLVQVDLSEKVTDVVARDNYAVFLTESGKVYGAGYDFGSTPVLLTDGADEIAKDCGHSNYFTVRKGQSLYYYSRNNLDRTITAQSSAHAVNLYNDFYIKDGMIFGKPYNLYGAEYGQLGVGDTKEHYTYTQMQKISDALQVWAFGKTTFIQTEHGFYGTGYNIDRALANLTTENSSTPVRIFFGLQENAGGFHVETINLSENNLRENTIVLGYNEALIKGSNYGTITLKNSAGEMVSLRRTIRLAQLQLTPVAALTEGETYTLTMPVDALETKFGTASEAATYTFTYHAPTPASVDSLTLGNTTLTAAITTETDIVASGTDLGTLTDIFGKSTTFANAAKTVNWAVADESIATVTDLGHLIALRGGCTVVTAAMEGTELTASALLQVTLGDTPTAVVKNVAAKNTRTILFSDGALYALAADGTTQTLFTDAADFQWDDGKLWVQTKDGTLYCDGAATEDAAFAVKYTNLLTCGSESLLAGADTLTLTTNKTLYAGEAITGIACTGDTSLQVQCSGNQLLMTAEEGFTSGQSYTITVPAGAVSGYFGATNQALSYTFTYLDRLTDGAVSLMEGENRTVTVLASGAVSDDTAAAARTWTEERVQTKWTEFCEDGYNTNFFGNVILNRFTENNVEKWLRIQAPESSTYAKYGIGGNYWGTAGLSESTKKLAINKQIIDYDDYQQYADLNEGIILETVPETVWPVVSNVGIINSAGELTTTIGKERVTFFVEFNIDMATDTDLQVRFGSSYPYADYEVDGKWVNARRWEGSTSITTLIGSGNQYWSIANGVSAQGWKLYKDWGRFSFKIDTASAMALTMQAAAESDGISLTWEQDDFDTLAGYNVYRSEDENGYYQKINSTVIPADTKTFKDTDVYPGQVYYYNFTVVQTDLSESAPSGKISVRAKDTMAPSIYHSGVYQAFTGSNLVISATVSDNVEVDSATLYYRITGTDSWKSVSMTHSNDKYSAIIPAQYLTLKGLQYYIEASDGNNFTRKGSAASPYSVVVQETVDQNSKGDVNGDGRISVLDALLVLQARNGLVNLTAEQFTRADINGDKVLSAEEALVILQYANGSIGSVKM